MYFVRSGVRSFGFVKSEAELNELAYELFEQEEVKLLIIINGYDSIINYYN